MVRQGAAGMVGSTRGLSSRAVSSLACSIRGEGIGGKVRGSGKSGRYEAEGGGKGEDVSLGKYVNGEGESQEGNVLGSSLPSMVLGNNGEEVELWCSMKETWKEEKT